MVLLTSNIFSTIAITSLIGKYQLNSYIIESFFLKKKIKEKYTHDRINDEKKSLFFRYQVYHRFGHGA